MTAPHQLPSPPPGMPKAGPADRVDIAVLVPCYNEESAIAAVVAGFRAALPHARVYVYDNNSRDNTAEVGHAGAAAAVAGFRAALPHARVYVYDNNSRDNTAEVAHAAGAIVRHERLQG